MLRRVVAALRRLLVVVIGGACWRVAGVPHGGLVGRWGAHLDTFVSSVVGAGEWRMGRRTGLL